MWGAARGHHDLRGPYLPKPVPLHRRDEVALPDAESEFEHGRLGFRPVLWLIEFAQEIAHGLARAGQRTHDEEIDLRIAEEALEAARNGDGLLMAVVVERDIDLTLDAAFEVPVGFAVADEIYRRIWLNHRFAQP